MYLIQGIIFMKAVIRTLMHIENGNVLKVLFNSFIKKRKVLIPIKRAFEKLYIYRNLN